jgi:hypothetical protein
MRTEPRRIEDEVAQWADDAARRDEHVSHRQGLVCALDVVVEELAQFGHRLGCPEIATAGLALALIEVPGTLMPALARKADDVAALIVGSPDPFDPHILLRFAIDPQLDELLEFGIADLLETDCKIGHERTLGP